MSVIRCRSLFLLQSFLFFLLHFSPSMAFSLKNCTVSYSDNMTKVWVGCSDRGLTAVPGDIPKNAVSLDLSSNHIVQIRRTDLSGLSKLRYLHLGKNWISHVDSGAFADLAELLELEMSLVNITRLTDNMFQGLWKLSVLSLQENHITSISPLAFQSLISLQTLRLNYNSLQRMTDIVPVLQLPNLHELFLDFNIFTSFDSGYLPFNTSNLRTLSIACNPMTKFSITRDIFPHLQSLYLSTGAGFKWNVPDTTFLRSLTVLDLYMFDINLGTLRQMLTSTQSLQKLALTCILNKQKQDLIDTACQFCAVTTLDLSVNRFGRVDNTLLYYCDHLTELSLSLNSLKEMSEFALGSVKKLRRLDLSKNYLTTVPVTIRGLSTLEILNLSSNFISGLDCSDFLNLTRLTELHLNENRISTLKGCVFQDLKDLKVLNISRNGVYMLVDFFKVNLQKLEVLDLHGNVLQLLHTGEFRHLPSLRYLDLESERRYGANNGAFEGLTNLQTLIVTPLMHGVMNFTGMPHLENLKLRITFLLKSSFYEKNDPPFTQLPSLKNLMIQKYDGHYDISPDFLKGLKFLEHFAADRFFTVSPHHNTFKYTPHLTSLHITQSDLQDLIPELFQPIPNLQALDLSNNKLTSLDFLAQVNLSALSRLSLRENELTVINETVFQSLPALTYLDLFGNPFSCDCSNTNFIQWVKSNNQTQVVNAYQYDCSFPLSKKGTKLMDFDTQSCWMSVSLLCFISSTCLVLLTLLSSFIYHFLRWQLAYGFYLFLAFLYDSRKKKKGAPHQYDAFVSYNVQDEAWVYREMLPVLEGEQGWRLCLHHRDFQPGKPIMENITDAIYGSRKTICVISLHYLQSEWCSREIQMASFRLFDEQKDVLILLFLEEIPAQQLSPYYRMRKLVKRRTYLSWPQARQQPGVFWQNVRRALETGDAPADTNLLTGPGGC